MKGIRRGRPSLGISESLVKSYRFSKEQFNEFENWCECRGLTLSEGIRGSISLIMNNGSLDELLNNPEMKAVAVELLAKN